MEPGVYINLPFEEYLQIKMLSSTSIKHLCISQNEFWNHSWFNPNRELYNKPSRAKDLGTAYHKMFLEGEEEFWKEYCLEFNPGDYPDALTTASDMKVVLKDMGCKVSGTKSELIERISGNGGDYQFIDNLKEQYELENYGKKVIGKEQLFEVTQGKAWLDNYEPLKQLVDNGHPEVTVIFKYKGVSVRCRFDYLRPGLLTDLKTVNKQARFKKLEEIIAMEIASSGYHVQAYLYLVALKKALEMIKEGKVYGNDKSSLNSLLDVPFEDYKFAFLFHQTGLTGAQRAVYVDPSLDVMDKGRSLTSAAVDTFKNNEENYKKGIVRPDQYPPYFINNEDFPFYAAL